MKKRENNSKLEEPLAGYAVAGSAASFIQFLGGNSVVPDSSQIKGKYDYIEIIRKGLSRKSLDYLMDYTGISALEMSEIIHTSDRTLRRYTSDTILNPEQSERAIELARLYSRGEEVFGSLNDFKKWMSNEVLALNNKKPKEFLDTSLGIEMLMEELGRIEHGIFA